MFQVTCVLSREPIMAHGLDWTRMGAAPGIAGNRAPEVEGVFLCLDESDVGFFLHINNTGGPVVQAVDDIDRRQLIRTGSASVTCRRESRAASCPARSRCTAVGSLFGARLRARPFAVVQR
jgi:hypothetical protein